MALNHKIQKGDYVKLHIFPDLSSQEIYEVDWCAVSLILKDKKGIKFSARHSDVEYVPPEKAMLWILESK